MRARSLERGQVLPLVAVCLAVLMGFSAMAVDVGFLEYRQRQQQSAADAAAIGGAQQLAYAGCNNQSAANTAGQADAATNGFPDESSTNGPITVTINNPPASGPYTGNNCAVEAVITNTQTQTFFSRLFGQANGMAETTAAVAVSSDSAPLCALQLGAGGTPTFHGNKISASGCSLAMNGSPTFHGGTIDFSSIGYAGSSITETGTKWVEASPAPMLPMADPCQEIAGCRYLADNPPSTSNCSAFSGTNPTPGCYSSFNVTGGAMAPGLYVLTGTSSFGAVTGSGVTIYVAAGASTLDMSGIKGNITACTTSCGTGTYAAIPNVLYYQVPSNTNSLTWSGPQSVYSGLIYAPGADLTINGNGGSGYSLFIFNDWTINGTGSGMTFTPPSSGQSLLPQAVLVQ